MADSKKIAELLYQLIEEGDGRITIVIQGSDTKISEIYKEFTEEVATEKSPEAYKKDIQSVIANLLMEMGARIYCRGYIYLKEALYMCFNDMGCCQSITKNLYQTIAKKFRKSLSTVERAIRYQIEAVWKNKNNSKLKEMFGDTGYFTTTRPTNSQFISTVAKKLRKQFNKD